MKSYGYILLWKRATAVLTLGFAAAFSTGCGSTSNSESTTQEQEADLSEAVNLFSPPPAPAASDAQMERVVARIDGTEVTQADLLNEANMLMARMQGRVPPERLAQMQDEIMQGAMDNLIIKQLLLNKVEKDNVQATEEEVNEMIEMYRQQIPPGMTLEAQLAQINMTEEDFRQNVTRELRVNKLLEEKVSGTQTASDEDIQTFYEEHLNDYFALPESAKASHILVTARAGEPEEDREAARTKAEEIREKLLAGADFAELAQSESECPSATQGGDLGTFQRGQMVPAFEEAAFTQPIGEIGEVVETDFGFHVIQVQERFEAGVQPLEEAREQIAQFLSAQTRELALRDYVTQLREEADIEFVQ